MSENTMFKSWLRPLEIVLASCFIVCLSAQAATTTPGSSCGIGPGSVDDADFLWPDGDSHILLQYNFTTIFTGQDYGPLQLRRCYFGTEAELVNPDSTCNLTTPEVIASPETAYVALIDKATLKYCAYKYEVDTAAMDVRTNGVIVLPPAIRAPILEFEEPLNGGTSNGIANVRGWMVSDIPIARVDLYVDGALLGEIPYGGARPDIVTAHPTFPNSDKSGFSMAYGYSQLSVGPHSMQVKAYDGASNLLAEKTSAFNLVAFDNDFIGPAAPVNLSGVSFAKPHVLASPTGLKRFRMDDAVLDGVSYDLLFEWNSATQKFEMIEINH